jgi:predicted dithiol-disulfide oxidoreductase (DUF899 family)
MVGTQGMKKKDEIAQIISSILDQAARTRKGFTPDVVNEFFDEGMRSAQRREEVRRTEAEVPHRQLGAMVASRRDEGRAMISPVMTQRAIESAVDLGERLELASQGRRLSLRDWVSG